MDTLWKARARLLGYPSYIDNDALPRHVHKTLQPVELVCGTSFPDLCPSTKLSSNQEKRRHVLKFNACRPYGADPGGSGILTVYQRAICCFGTLPWVRRAAQRTRVVRCRVDPNTHFEQFERDLLLAHAEYGCISIWCVTSGRAYPFVFLPRIVKRVVPCLQLLYCREIEDFIQFSSQIGFYLGMRGKLFVLIDSKRTDPRPSGKYFDGISPKYYKGPVLPRLGDLAYTELAMLPRIFETTA